MIATFKINSNIKFLHDYVINSNGGEIIRTCFVADKNIGFYKSLVFLKECGLDADDYIADEIVKTNPKHFTYTFLKMKFNPENKTSLTIGECLAPAMEIKTQKIADEYMKDYIAYLDKEIAWSFEAGNAIARGDFTTAEQLAKTNLSYYAGYYDDETRERVERLFDCEHPIFGRLSEMGKPTGEESFQCGMQRKTLKEIRNKK